MNLKKEDINLYNRIHRYIKRRLPKPEACNRCKQALSLELSNNSRMYMMELGDWEWICRSCHAKKDRWALGRKLSQETKDKIGKANSISLLGHTPWNKGKKTSSVEVKCIRCKNKFYVCKWKYDHGRGKFCSTYCRKTYYLKP